MDDLPSVRLLRGEEQPEPMLLRTIEKRTGEEHWVLLKAAAVRDGGRARSRPAVTIIEDVTASKRMQLRSEFLARAATLLASSLDYQQTLQNVAGLAVPALADWCGVDLIDEDGHREPVAVAHVDPSRVELATRLRAYEPEHMQPDRGDRQGGRVRASRRCTTTSRRSCCARPPWTRSTCGCCARSGCARFCSCR